MKLGFRTIVGKIFEIEISPNNTLNDAKPILKKNFDFDASNCIFISKSAILVQNLPIKNLDIDTKTYIVIYEQPISTETNRIEKIVKTTPEEPLDVDIIEPPTNIPEIIEQEEIKEPENFDELVSNLCEMGFAKEECEKALRESKYNPEAAVSTLIANNINNDPVPPPSPRNDPPRPSGRYRELQPTYDALTEEEKSTLEGLSGFGLDHITVLQVYLACDKNVESTINCINTMIN